MGKLKPPLNLRRVKNKSCGNCKYLGHYGDGIWDCQRNPEETTKDLGDYSPLEYVCDRHVRIKNYRYAEILW